MKAVLQGKVLLDLCGGGAMLAVGEGCN